MYETVPRGTIKHINRFKQVISFEGMERLRKITPTDIDGFIDYGGKFFIYMECKHENKNLEYGQRLAMESVVKSHTKAGHKACAIWFTHNSASDEVIICRDAKVKMVYGVKKGILRWIEIYNKTVMNVIEELEKYWGIK